MEPGFVQEVPGNCANFLWDSMLYATTNVDYAQPLDMTRGCGFSVFRRRLREHGRNLCKSVKNRRKSLSDNRLYLQTPALGEWRLNDRGRHAILRFRSALDTADLRRSGQ